VPQDRKAIVSMYYLGSLCSPSLTVQEGHTSYTNSPMVVGGRGKESQEMGTMASEARRKRKAVPRSDDALWAAQRHHEQAITQSVD